MIVTFLGGEGSACVQSAMSVLLSLMSSALQWLVIKVIRTNCTNNSDVLYYSENSTVT